MLKPLRTSKASKLPQAGPGNGLKANAANVQKKKTEFNEHHAVFKGALGTNEERGTLPYDVLL
jgi:hypothetical protein